LFISGCRSCVLVTHPLLICDPYLRRKNLLELILLIDTAT
jgi:hypothetical protein